MVRQVGNKKGSCGGHNHVAVFLLSPLRLEAFYIQFNVFPRFGLDKGLSVGCGVSVFSVWGFGLIAATARQTINPKP
jgi:hypothetical protein